MTQMTHYQKIMIRLLLDAKPENKLRIIFLCQKVFNWRLEEAKENIWCVWKFCRSEGASLVEIRDDGLVYLDNVDRCVQITPEFLKMCSPDWAAQLQKWVDEIY